MERFEKTAEPHFPKNLDPYNVRANDWHVNWLAIEELVKRCAFYNSDTVGAELQVWFHAEGGSHISSRARKATQYRSLLHSNPPFVLRLSPVHQPTHVHNILLQSTHELS